ncbi:Zn-dependent hydrolase [Paenibacillus odorifer]|uniref:Allantoate amidohydrolase n=1 Tax=Paenibacillus odorifer TaxID=189426 RepID=A0A1R0XWB9_9BACL|nr:Zn-dependent hydrolase [Paenibacillus odorifer]OMD39242.1 allantoate amidohydrolase [Paenibacillus odorifer]
MNDSRVQASTQKLLELLEELGAYTASGPGVTRLLYTKEWRQAQIFLQQKMVGFGLKVTTDKVGNVYGRLCGRSPEEKVILTGSHIDTVVNGGKYDGAYGIAAAMVALQVLQMNYGQPKRTLEVVSFCEEEGSRFPLAYWGSGHVTERYDGSEAATCKDADGISLQAAMEEFSFLQGVTDGNGARNDIGAFVELHIEQGIILEKTDTQIGVVQGIVGQRRYMVKVSGVANHAGTTPMLMRQDALASAVEMLYVLEGAAKLAGEPLVATSGKLEVHPNTPNVIPGEVLFTLDIRHIEEDDLECFCAKLFSRYYEITAERGVTLEVTPVLHTLPAPMDTKFSTALENICRQQGKTYRTMVSGAGHDAQLFAPRCPTAMIFVPSRAGISHSPEEYTSPKQLAAGLEVLTAMLYELAY